MYMDIPGIGDEAEMAEKEVVNVRMRRKHSTAQDSPEALEIVMPKPAY